MGKVSNLFIQLEEAIEAGQMTFAEIATFYEVPRSWVDEVARQLAERYTDEALTPDSAEWFE